MKLVRKLTLALLGGIAVIVAAETYLSVRRFVDFYDSDVRRDLRVIGRLLSAEIESEWPQYGPTAAMRLVQRADTDEPTLSLRWVSFDAGPPSDVPTDLAQDLLARMRAGKDYIRSEHAGAGTLHTYFPVRVDGRLVGAIQVSESASAKQEFVRARILQRALTASAMLLFCGGLAWFAGSRFVGRPVGALMDQARRIGSGDFSARLDLQGADELSELARDMNAMAAKLADSRRALEMQNAARLDAIEQLRHADRLKTVGTLSSGVAHELGTPLNVVSGRAQMIVAGEVSGPAETVEAARIIHAQADRMARIVRQLLDFARRGEPEKQPSDLVQMAREAITMLTPLARKRKVNLGLVPPASQSIVAVVDKVQLGQAVTNLIINAVQATREGGNVETRVSLERAAPPGVPPTAALPCACISVSDEGPGIPEEQLQQLFDPFFTTKDVGEGTGLGLSVAHGIVTEHGGWIEVRSEVGVGSSFRIWLPEEAAP